MAKDDIRIDRITSHFEEEAKEYDNVILSLIPNYKLMVEALVAVIPFNPKQSFSIIDLGCGTGTISRTIKDRFPNINVTCVDIAKNMLDIANAKLSGSANLIQADFYDFEFPQKYDVIVSSLALHHLETDQDKLKFYRKIFSALNNDGMFINIDVVLGSDEPLNNIYLEKWKSFMYQSTSPAEAENKWLPNYYAEDRPASMLAHLSMLGQCGFACLDIVYKYYNYAVYLAKK